MNFEKKLSTAGFNKLQEKEDFIFYAKSTMQNSEDVKQICIIYDKKRNKIRSMETFVLKDNVLNVVENELSVVDYVSNILSS